MIPFEEKASTTRQMAEYIDVVSATILMYENGKKPIPYDAVLKLTEI